MDDGGAADARLDFQEGETAGKSGDSGKTGDVEERRKGVPAEASGEDELEACLEQLKKENEELTQVWLRLRADFENYRRRSREELQRARGQALEEFILKLLPVVDNLERALAAAAGGSGDDANLRTGVAMVYRQFMAVLAEEGVTPIAAVGEIFDPEKHEAFCREESEKPENTILEEFQKGYLFGEKTIRPSLVKVAAAGTKTAAGETKEEGIGE
jgi:molecular chaperone GrpE